MDQWNKGGFSREEFLRMRETAMRQLQEMAKNHPMPQKEPPRKERDIRREAQQPAGTAPADLIPDEAQPEPEREALLVAEPVLKTLSIAEPMQEPRVLATTEPEPEPGREVFPATLPMTESEPEPEVPTMTELMLEQEPEPMPIQAEKEEHEAADPAFLDMLDQVNETARMLERQWEEDAAKASLEQAQSVPLYQPEIRFSVEREEVRQEPDQWAGQKLPLWEPSAPRQEDEWMEPVLPYSHGRQDLPPPPDEEGPWAPPVPVWEEKPSTVYHPDGAAPYKMPKNTQYHPDAGMMEQGARSFRRAGRRRIGFRVQEGAKKK